jgi:hypothetical protein
VRAEPDPYTAIRGAMPLAGECAGLLKLGLRILAEHRPRQMPTQATRLDRLGHAIHRKIVVGDRRHPAFDRLDRRQQRAPVDIIRRKVCLQ